MVPVRLRPALLLWLLVTAWASESAPAQGYREHYRLGRKAFDEADWEQVVRRMRLAIEDRPQERGRMVQLGFGRYLPRYFLGSALAELGRCPEALGVWVEEEVQGAITRVEDFHRDMLRRRTECQQHLGAVDEALVEGRAVLTEAISVGEEAERALAAPEPPDEGLVARLADARDLLAEASSALERSRAGSSLEEAQAGAELALRGRDALEAVLDEALSRKVEVAELTAEKREEVARVAENARRDLARASQLAPLPPGLAVAASAVGGHLDRFANEPALRMNELVALERQLRRDLERLRAAMMPPPRLLEAAAEAHLQGLPEEVLAVLEGVELTGRRQVAHACLLRIVSWHRLYLRSDQLEQSLLDRASSEVDACPDLARYVELSPRLFSPALRTFVEYCLAATFGPPPPTDAGAGR